MGDVIGSNIVDYCQRHAAKAFEDHRNVDGEVFAKAGDIVREMAVELSAAKEEVRHLRHDAEGHIPKDFRNKEKPDATIP